MGVRVDEAGEEQLAADVHDLCLRAGKIGADPFNALAVDQHIGALPPVRVDDDAALE